VVRTFEGCLRVDGKTLAKRDKAGVPRQAMSLGYTTLFRGFIAFLGGVGVFDMRVERVDASMGGGQQVVRV
jgi:hypothetical protein